MTQFEDVLETILEEYARRDSEGEFDTLEETDAFVKKKAEVLLAYVKEEPVSEELEEASKEWLIPQLDKSYANYGEVKMMELTHFDGYAMLDAIEFGAQWQKQQDFIVSEDLEKVAELYTLDDSIKPWKNLTKEAFKAGTNWQKTHLWKPADGDDLPEIDREVIALIEYKAQRNIHDEEYPTYIIGFAHRPDSKGWNGKSISTGKIEHYTPKTYGKGGWNIPNIVYWLDVELPKKIEL